MYCNEKSMNYEWAFGKYHITNYDVFIIIFLTFIDAELWGFDDVYKVGNSQSQTESQQVFKMGCERIKLTTVGTRE